MPRSDGVAHLIPSYFAMPGETIRTEQHNPVLEDIANMLTGSMARDGSAPMLTNLPMNGFRVTNIGNAVNPGDAARLSQVQSLIAEEAFPSGTKMLFMQATAPLGWTQDTDVNDKVIRVVSGSGGGTGGSWTISGLSVPHTHPQQGTFTSGPPNTGILLSVDNGPDANVPRYGEYETHAHQVTISGSTGGASNAAVSSSGAWRPSYIDVIAAVKD